MSKKKKKIGKNNPADKPQNKNTKAQKIKKTLPIVIASVVAMAAVAAVVVFNALGNVNNSSQTSTEGTTNETSKSEESSLSKTSSEAVSGKYDLDALHSVSTDSDDKFAGTWKISSGSGSQYTDFYYMFDGDGMSYLITGTCGYFGNYSFETDESGTKTLTTQLVFGLNGSYTYEFSGDDKVTLTSTDGSTETVLTKADDLDFIPSGSADARIDENLVGCWASGTGEYFCFDTNGVMYQNLFDSMFTFSTYTAKDGKITSSYTTSDDPSTDEYTYSIEGDTLTLDDTTYTRTDFDELCSH